jgi:hypothetical protein
MDIEEELYHCYHDDDPNAEGLNDESDYIKDCVLKLIQIAKDTAYDSSGYVACKRHPLFKTIEVKQELIDAIFQYDLIDILVFECWAILLSVFEMEVPENRRGKVRWITEEWKARYWNGELKLS